MDFSLTDEQKNLVTVFREFGTATFTPRHVAQWCRDQGLPDDVVKTFVDLYYGTAPASDSAAGHSLLSQALIIEELSRCAGTTLPFQNDLFNLQIMDGFSGKGDMAQVLADYRDTGRLTFSLAISEPNGGSDTKSMQTNTQTVDGKLLLNGRKSYVNNGEYAPMILVAAIDRDDPNPGKYPSLAFWLVPHSLEGIKAVPVDKIGQSMLPFASLSFENVELDESYRLSGNEGGFKHLFQLLEIGRILLCASSVGMAQAAMEDAVAYASKRDAFGQKVKNFQQIEEMVTDMEARLYNMRSMLYRAAWSVDNEASDRRLSVALMKRYVPSAALDVASDAMQILGGFGYTTHARASRIWRDCRGNLIAEGTDQIMVYIAAPLIYQKYNNI
jgi:alkylation response protein AidB-like acyl-CoA dehydrogenase